MAHNPNQPVPSYFFEIYTKNPETLETGWEIEIGHVIGARDREHAIEWIKLKFGRLLDTVVQCHRSILSPLGAIGRHPLIKAR